VSAAPNVAGLICVRGYPLAVTMGLVDSRTAYTAPRLASTSPSDMPFSGGFISVTRRTQKNRPVVRGARSVRDFFHLPDTMRDMLVSKHGS
jgi:hypothetical protein